MGLIKKIFSGIFGLIASIFKVFGFGKKSEFYMELDSSGQSASATSSASEAKPAIDKAAPVKVVATDESKKPAQASYTEQIPVVPESSPQSPPPAVPGKAQMPEVTNFATDYLVNPKINPSPRRRPGPSMSPFKEMVRDMGRKSASMG